MYYPSIRYDMFHSARSAGDADAQAIIDAMGTTPDATRQALITTLVTDLKAAVTWARWKRLFMLAAHAEDSSLLDWINPTGDPALNVSATSFTIDEGYTGDGIADYIDTQYNPATDTKALTIDDVTAGIYIRNNVAEDKFAFGARGSVSNYLLGLQPRTSTSLTTYTTNSGSGVDTGITDSRGMFIIRRDDGANHELFRNGVQTHTEADANTAIPSAKIAVLANNVNGSVGSFSTYQASIFFVCDAMTNGEILAVNTAFEKFMDAIGKGVQT